MNLYLVSIALLIFCSLITSSNGSNNNPAYLETDVYIDCGSSGTSAALNGKEWIGDVSSKYTASLSLQIKGSSKISSLIHKLISSDPVPHKTARASSSQFSYVFHLSPGQKIIRFHFNPNPYKGFKNFKDLFTVEAGPFILLSNFSASLTAQALGVSTFTKEFCISIEKNQPLNIVFSPDISPSQDVTYAFINGIEIVSVPESLTYFRGGDLGAQVVGQKSLVYIDNSTALEMIHRLKVKRDSVSPGDDVLKVKQDSVSSGDEFDMFGIWAAVSKRKANEISSLTWKRSVDVGFRYLVRIYFSELGLKMAQIRNTAFKVLVNEMIVDSETDIIKERDENDHLWYRDYMMVMKGRKQEGQRDLLISVQSNNEFIDGHGPLKGFEVFKLSNPDNSLASPNLLPPARDLPAWTIQNLLSVLSCRNVIATVVVTILGLVNIIVHEVRKIREAKLMEEENKPSVRAERHCRRFSMAEIQSATMNFSDALIIGRGGFGIVYKGLIDNGRETVAIKRSKSSSKQGPREFWTEIETLSELRHNNLVSLIGYCNEYREMILVYDYMRCGTLADHLYKHARDSDKDSSLTWKQRLNICIGAARGLDYLHTGQRIIHRDVKSSNILLDENFISKVSDFGLAKPEDRGNSKSHVSTNVKGTPGYVDPYYFNTWKLTTKSDTYAFGVVLLEVLCGRPAMDRSARGDEYCLTKWARNRINMGEVDQIVESSLIGEISPDSLKVFIGIAERCLHDEPKERPTMAEIVVRLAFALEHQESSNAAVSNHITSVADHETIFPVSNEQLTESSSPIERSNNRSIKIESRDENKNGRNENWIHVRRKKPKMYRTSLLWAWDARWNWVRPSKKKEIFSTSPSVSRKKQGGEEEEEEEEKEEEKKEEEEKEEEEGLTPYKDFHTSGLQGTRTNNTEPAPSFSFFQYCTIL